MIPGNLERQLDKNAGGSLAITNQYQYRGEAILLYICMPLIAMETMYKSR